MNATADDPEGTLDDGSILPHAGHDLLGRLPFLDVPQSDRALIVQGLLVPSPSGRIRIILDGLWMEFGKRDIIDAEELPPLETLRPGAAIHARFWLRQGTRLLGVGASEPYRDSLFASREPFAVAVRQGEVSYVPTPRYSALEVKYLDSHGLRPLTR